MTLGGDRYNHPAAGSPFVVRYFGRENSAALRGFAFHFSAGG
jgi:hypothetical protein